MGYGTDEDFYTIDMFTEHESSRLYLIALTAGVVL